MKQFYLILLTIFFLNGRAQTDTEFWFAAPEVSAHTANFDKPIVLRITAYNQASTITISQPANPGFTPIVVNVAANATSTTDLTPWIAQIENQPPNTVLNYGLLITATTPVTIYYEVVSQQCLCNPEIFALKGKNALGTNFFIPSQNFVNNNNGYNPQPYSSFDIVATDDNTTVTINPTNNIVGHAAGVPFNITLNKGQTFSATATSQAAAQHLMGSTVTSTKPVAITIKDDLMTGAAFGGCADLGGDQIVPIDYIGTKYAVVRGFLNAPFDKVFVLATQNGTTVSVDGTLVTTINTGQTYMVDMPNAARFIETSAPVYVLQLSGFGCEIGLSVLPPIECTGSTSVAITRSTSESLFLNLIVRTGGQNNFLFNGATGIINGASFAPVPGSGGVYQYAQVTITTGQLAAGAAAIVSNTTDFFHLGIIHGTGTGGTRFGYFSNFNRIEVDADGFSVPVCEGFPIQLNANSPFPSATFSWTGPNNFASVQKNPVIPNAQPINAGNYVVVATVSGCPSTPDTVPVAVTNCGQPISGIINTYTPVSAIDICKNQVTVNSVNGFAVGGKVLLIQMKGAQINTTNTPAFGDVGSYDNAGNYEFAVVQSITGNQITFVNALQRTYDVAGIVQLVTVPQYTGNVHAINAPVTCQPWNGSTGGIVVFEAAGTVTLNSDIDASDKGFRAGVANDNSPYTCSQQDYFYPSNSPFGGRKGEGIFELPNTIINGRGKNANGGGGGNDTNSGGAGGGNGGGGGRGGNQWTGCPNLPIGGDGGLALQYSNAANKIFLGGGAGGGHQNDAVATPGTNGGGLIIVKSNGITANGGAIKSFALNAIQATGDGSGGAGAGGTVLLQTNNILGNLTIDVHGGKGGDNNSHGPGGGGGGGLVWTTTALPVNVTTNLAGGQPGLQSTTNTNHGAAAGANGVVITGLSLPESATPFTPLTKPVATASTNVCEGSTISLNASNVPNVSYSWTGPNSFTATQQNSTVTNAVLAATGDYIVAIQDALGCIERDTVTVNVRPKFSSTVNANICNGETYTLPDGNTATTSGVYISNLQTVKGCDSIITTLLDVLPNSFTTVDTFICPNTAFTRPSGLVVNTAGTYSDTLVAANFCDSVITTNLQFYPVYAQIITDTICNGVTYTLPDGNTATQSGTYNISLTTINGCDSLFTVKLAVLNVTATTVVTNAKCLDSSDGSITVNATGGVNPYTFVMNASTTQSGNNTSTFNNLAAGSYAFDITDAKGCTAITTAVVNEPTQVALTGIAANVTCFGLADGSAQLTATGGTPAYQYTLDNTSNSNGFYDGLTAGNYTATVRDANNCTATFAFAITEPDAVEVTINPETLVLKLGGKDSLRLTSNYDPDVVYDWNPKQGLSCYDCAAPLATSLNTITYTITANATINGNVCTAETQVQVIVEPDYTLFVPNMFSPNNDGANDYFAWYGNKDGIKQMEVQIFNRWGEKVFESEDKNFIWDGYFGGKPAPDGVYVYTIKVTWLNGFSNNKYKGSLMLVR